MYTVNFQIGQEYVNMKGKYEVLSIDGDSMLIRFADGEQIPTSVTLQTRIIDRMRREIELEQEKKEKKAKKASKISSRYGAQFKGFEETDFKGDVTGTKWRSRNFLGGAVSGQLDSKKFNFNSWAVYRSPAIHWSDVKHRDKKNKSNGAKFFAQIDNGTLSFGFNIERPENVAVEESDWSGFLTWLKEGDNETWLNKVASEHSLGIAEAGETFSGEITPSEGKWKCQDNGSTKEIDSLSDFFKGLPVDGMINLRIANKVPKDNAVSKKEKIAKDISLLFKELMPLYEASASEKE